MDGFMNLLTELSVMRFLLINKQCAEGILVTVALTVLYTVPQTVFIHTISQSHEAMKVIKMTCLCLSQSQSTH